MKRAIRVLVVDDSALMRTLIADLLDADPEIAVVGTACDGVQALEQIDELLPDVVTMDIKMPRMSGLEALKRIMSRRPLPVIVLSGLNDSETTLAALQLGAVDLVLKPSGPISVDLHKIRDALLAKVKAAAQVDAAGLVQRPVPPATKKNRAAPQLRIESPTAQKSQWVVTIAASTGGPRALDVLLRSLPAWLPASILAVQHMPKGFTAALAKRLDDRSELAVKEAEDGEFIETGTVYIAPAGRHLTLLAAQTGEGVQCHLDDSEPIRGLRPTADRLIESAAELFGERCIGVVLSGMGSDGTRGIQAIKRRGGKTIAQDRASSVIYGMPRSAAESGFVDRVLSLEEIAPALVHLIEQP
jgi:two-component system chemotaxis response regulator CheB